MELNDFSNPNPSASRDEVLKRTVVVHHLPFFKEWLCGFCYKALKVKSASSKKESAQNNDLRLCCLNRILTVSTGGWGWGREVGRLATPRDRLKMIEDAKWHWLRRRLRGGGTAFRFFFVNVNATRGKVKRLVTGKVGWGQGRSGGCSVYVHFL